MTYCDAHFHLVQCGAMPDFFTDGDEYYACTCAHDPDELLRQQELIVSCADRRVHIVPAFGMHPQQPITEYADFLEELLRKKAIGAIGEAGFDLFTPAFRADIARQEAAWQIQVALAAQYGVPLVVHCRKAMERLFRDAKKLKAVPAVIFHSFAGSPQDARSLVRHGIHGFFSFGKPLLNGKKSAIACVRDLPAEWLLLETDAPFQTLKGEARTEAAEIARVCDAAANLRGCALADLAIAVRRNFCIAFSCFSRYSNVND